MWCTLFFCMLSFNLGFVCGVFIYKIGTRSKRVEETEVKQQTVLSKKEKEILEREKKLHEDYLHDLDVLSGFDGRLKEERENDVNE